MRQAGCDILLPCEAISAMGFVEVLTHWRPIRQAFLQLKALLQGDSPPDMLLTVDFQEFNLRLAAAAKKAGVPVVHYVSPQLWAWRPGRARKVAAVVDKLAAILPFEPGYYAGLDIDVRYVGHPLLDDYRLELPAGALRKQLGIAPGTSVVGLFPGSRRNELKYNLPTLVATAKRLHAANPTLQFMVPVAPTLTEEPFRQVFADAGIMAHVTRQPIYDVIAACDVVAAVSGTVTLQVALGGTPLVIFYKMAPLSYQIAKRLVNIFAVGLPNIIAGRFIVRELIQDQATAESLAAEIQKLLTDTAYRDQVATDLATVRYKMGAPGSSQRVAAMALELLHSRATGHP